MLLLIYVCKYNYKLWENVCEESWLWKYELSNCRGCFFLEWSYLEVMLFIVYLIFVGLEVEGGLVFESLDIYDFFKVGLVSL